MNTTHKAADMCPQTIKELDLIKLPCGKYLGLVSTEHHKNLVNLKILCGGLYNRPSYGTANLSDNEGHLTVYLNREHNSTKKYLANGHPQAIAHSGRTQCVTADVLIKDLLSGIPIASEDARKRLDAEITLVKTHVIDRDEDDKVYLAEVIAYLQNMPESTPVTSQTTLQLPMPTASQRAYTRDEISKKIDALQEIKTAMTIQAANCRAAVSDREAAVQREEREQEKMAKLKRQESALIDDLHRGHDA